MHPIEDLAFLKMNEKPTSELNEARAVYVVLWHGESVANQESLNSILETTIN